MNKQMQALWKELELDGPCPAVDPRAVKGRVNAALNAIPSERKLYMRQKIRFGLVLAAAVITLCGTALAVSPTLRDLLTQAMGTFAPYAQEVDGVSAADRGIEIRVASTVADSRAARIYLAVRDLTGERIHDGNLQLNIDARRVGTQYRGWGYGGQCVSYDPETRTAIYELRFHNLKTRDGFEELENLPIALEISAVQPGYQNLNGHDAAILPQELLTDKRLADTVLDTGETVLVPGQTPYAFPGTGVISLSSLGFDGEGRLHIQVQMPKPVDTRRNTIHLLSTIRSKTDPNLNRGYHEGEESGGQVYTTFQWEGNWYYDIRYPTTTAQFSDIRLGDIYGSFETEPTIEGAWNLTVPITEQPPREIAMNEAIGGMLVKKLTLSPLSASIETVKNPDAVQTYTLQSFALTAFFADGTHRLLDYENGGLFVFQEAIDPEQVTGIAINQWMIPIHGATAGPGYWLPEQPV